MLKTILLIEQWLSGFKKTVLDQAKFIQIFQLIYKNGQFNIL